MRSFSKTWYGFTLSSSLNFGYTSILIYSQFGSSRYKIHRWISGRKQKTNKPTRAATVYQKAIAVPFNKLTKHKTICHRQIFEWPMQKHPKDPMRKKTFSRDSFFFCFATVLLYYECNLAEITWICNFPRREEVCMYCIDSLISKISPNTTNQFKYNISPYPIFLLWTTQTLQNIKKTARTTSLKWTEEWIYYYIFVVVAEFGSVHSHRFWNHMLIHDDCCRIFEMQFICFVVWRREPVRFQILVLTMMQTRLFVPCNGLVWPTIGDGTRATT